MSATFGKYVPLVRNRFHRTTGPQCKQFRAMMKRSSSLFDHAALQNSRLASQTQTTTQHPNSVATKHSQHRPRPTLPSQRTAGSMRLTAMPLSTTQICNQIMQTMREPTRREVTKLMVCLFITFSASSALIGSFLPYFP